MTECQILRVIGENIRAARLGAGITQECLAELLEIHWQTVSNIERGLHPFSVTTFAAISQFLKVDANALLARLPAPDKKRADQIKKALARKRKVKSL